MHHPRGSAVISPIFTCCLPPRFIAAIPRCDTYGLILGDVRRCRASADLLHGCGRFNLLYEGHRSDDGCRCRGRPYLGPQRGCQRLKPMSGIVPFPAIVTTFLLTEHRRSPFEGCVSLAMQLMLSSWGTGHDPLGRAQGWREKSTALSLDATARHQPSRGTLEEEGRILHQGPTAIGFTTESFGAPHPWVAYIEARPALYLSGHGRPARLPAVVPTQASFCR
jgi:hypothetical protein